VGCLEQIIAEDGIHRHSQASQNRSKASRGPAELVGARPTDGLHLTLWSGSSPSGGRGAGNYIYYGRARIRHERSHDALALHGGIIPYGGTFLTFSDYSRNALRMAALMKIRSIFVFTHDSYRSGEGRPHTPSSSTPRRCG